MSLDANLQNLAIRTAREDKALRTLINGNAVDLEGLATNDKSSLVAAINEIKNSAPGSGGGSSNPVWVEQAGAAHTLSGADLGKGISMTSDTENVVVVPNDDEANIPVNSRIEVEMAGEGTTVIAADSGVQIFCDPRMVKRIASRYCTALLTKRGTNIWRLVGSLTLADEIDPPTIDSFTRTPSTIDEGDTATLTWTSSGGSTASISPGIGGVPLDGSISVAPTSDTTYVLTVANEAGEVTSSVSITVTPAAPPQSDDEHWESVVSLLNGDSLTDETGRHTWTASDGTPTFANGMIQFDGATSISTSGNLDDFAFDGDFTIEGEIDGTVAGAAATAIILNNYDGTAGSFQLYARGTPNYNLGLYVEGGPGMEPAGTPVITDDVVSWAITRSGTVTRLFIAGQVVATQDNAAHDWSMATPGVMCIGKELASNSKFFKGGYRHRITKGVCRYAGTYTPPTFPLPGAPEEPEAPPISGDIVDSNGVVLQSVYEDIAKNYSLPAKGLAYRYGPAATAVVSTTLQQRPDINSILYGSSARIYYQYGLENNTLNNDYVSNHGCAIYRPDNNLTSVAAAVGRFCTYQIDRRTISQRPQLMWNSAQLLPPQVSDYIAGNATYNSAQLSTSEAADLPVVQFRWAGPADAGADRMSLVGTQGSPTRGAFIFTVGTETGQQRGIVQLAPGKVPTGIAVTAGAEFALVSLWDYLNFRGQIAVIALGSVPMGCTWQNVDNWYDWWHGPTDMCHPGFKNPGGWAFMKVLGYVNLPSTMKAPTSIHAYTGTHPYETVYHDDGSGNLSISGMGKECSPFEANRARMLDNEDMGRWFHKGGIVAVASKSEKTVCVYDLAPLITYFNDMYLGSAQKNIETQYYQLNGAGAPASGLGANGKRYLNTTNGDVYLKTAGAWAVTHNIGTKRGLGMTANHWPYLLADVPQAMPTLIKTITLPDNPIGICSPVSYNYWSKDWQRRNPGTPYWMAAPRYPRLWVATTNGKIYIYSVGRWVPGAKPPDQAPNPNEIAQIGLITGLGEQITHINGVKDYDVSAQGVVYDDPGEIPGSLDEMVQLVDRKNRKIVFVQFTHTTGDGGSIVAFLQDSRMDPTECVGVDGYYKSNKVILVADPTGKCVRTYRVRTPVPLTYNSDGVNNVAYPTLDVGGEYGGKLDVPGIPFSVGTCNAP